MSEVSEELSKEIDEAVEASSVEVTVVSEGSEEEVIVPEKTEEVSEAGTEAGEEETTEPEGEVSTGRKVEDDPTDPVETEVEPETERLATFSGESLAYAMRNGLSFSEAKTFGSEKELVEFTSRLEYDRKAVSGSVTQGGGEPKPAVDPFADLPKLDPENFDPEVVDMFDRLTGIVKGQYETINNLQGSQQEFQRQHQESANSANLTEVSGWFDKQVNELGDDFKDDLGEGNFASLDSNGSQYAKRDEIANQMSILIAGHKSNNIAVPPREKVFDTAMRMVLGNRFSEIEKNKLSGKLESQSKQLIRRTGKTSPSATKTPDDEDKELADLLDQKFSG